MALSIHTNYSSLVTQTNLTKTNNALGANQQRLGTGLRINSAADDAAGLQIATRLNAQTRGMGVAQRNTQNGISMLQTAEGALDEVSNIVLRMKDLATEGANGTATAADLTAMKAEFDDLALELENITTNTKFGGQALLGATGKLGAAAVTFQIGSDVAEKYAFDASTEVKQVSTDITALKGNAFGNSTDANNAINLANTVLSSVGAARAKLGAGANRLDHVFNNLQNMSTNVTAAKGRIMDVDYATETSNMTTKQMLMQASSSMLKQSNSMSGMVMSLLQ